MGWLSDKLFGKRKRIDTAHIDRMMAPTQDLITQQKEFGTQMMDPKSAINMQFRRMMAQRSAETGAQSAQQMQKMSAMHGISPAQAMMQQRMAMNQAMGGVNDQMLQNQQSMWTQGAGMLGAMINPQSQMNQGQVGAYTGQINASNQRRAGNMAFGQQALGALIGASDKRLKQNIKLVDVSPKGHNIYEFDYRDSKYGPDRYRGVMAQEVSFAAKKDPYGYYFVDYSHPDLDVNFERVK
jgi:hypothetical protein